MVRAWIAFAALAVASAAHAQQQWPSASVRVLVANSPGTATDVAARVFSDQISKNTGGSIVVENRPGADGYLAAQECVRSPADGTTLFFASSCDGLTRISVGTVVTLFFLQSSEVLSKATLV